MKNLHNKKLKKCSLKTGFYRNGYCLTGPEDLGTHTVCAKITKNFLDFSKSRGNDLSSVVKPGENWCLCENRWLEAYNVGMAPRVIENATNSKTRKKIKKKIKKLKVDKRKTHRRLK